MWLTHRGMMPIPLILFNLKEDNKMIEQTRLYRLLKNTNGFISLTYDGCEYVLMKRYCGTIQRYIFSENTHFTLLVTYNIRYHNVSAPHGHCDRTIKQLFFSLNELEKELKERSFLMAENATIRFDGKSIIIYSKP